MQRADWSLATRKCNISYSRQAGTLPGMRYQAAPHRKAVFVRCVIGAIYDVMADPRAGSPARPGWIGVGLSAQNRSAVYIPEGFAHGLLTLREDTEVLYQMGAF